MALARPVEPGRLGFPEAYAGARVAVLGASGFIGRWVAHALCARGATVCLAVRDRPSAESVFSRYGVRGEIFDLDLAVPGGARAFFREAGPSITFNLAGYGVDPAERDEESAYRINAQLVEEICRGVAETRDPAWPGQHLVHTGSALEYGAVGGDLSEDSAPNPTTLYGRSKLAGTEQVKDRCKPLGIRGLTARLFTVYGPGERRGRLLPSLLEATRTGAPLNLTAGAQRRDFTYVEDVAEGLLRLGLAPAQPGEAVNLATGRLTSVRSFCETAVGILRTPSERLRFGVVPIRTEEMEHSEVTVERLRRLTGWTPPTGIAEGIRKTMDFQREPVDERA
jgi:nucleoside-diphosphate-sugar epimerase